VQADQQQPERQQVEAIQHRLHGYTDDAGIRHQPRGERLPRLAALGANNGSQTALP
jgi:hypothetical protein